MRYSERKKSKRIVILCEGDTEVIAVKEFIKRRWETDGLKEIGLATDDLRGKIEDLFDKVPIYRKSDSKVIATFTLIDLYGLNQVKHKPDDDLDTKVNQAKEWLRKGVGDLEDFFYPHLCVHETEAWFLAEGECLAQRLKNQNIKPDPHAEIKNLQIIHQSE